MKKLIALLTAATVLAGCATGPDKVALQARKDAIDKIGKVEIFYNGIDELTVVDGGGSSMSGMSGLLGPIGMLIVLGVDASSKLTRADRAKVRSKEFTDKVAKDGSEQNLNRLFAEELAAPIRAMGKEVKVTSIPRIEGDGLSVKGLPNVQTTPGYAPLVLRITTGYVAQDSFASYTPVIVIEHAFRSEGQEKPLYQNTFRSAVTEPSYLAYSSILDKSKQAHDGLRRGMNSAATAVYKSTFVQP